MRQLAYILLVCLFAFLPSSAQMRISRQYNNVSLSEALLQLQSEQSEYAINFIYDELEDFKVTTDIRHKSLPDAIQQMIGFYPVRMTVKPEDNEIYVECTHKTDLHQIGRASWRERVLW